MGAGAGRGGGRGMVHREQGRGNNSSAAFYRELQTNMIISDQWRLER